MVESIIVQKGDPEAEPLDTAPAIELGQWYWYDEAKEVEGEKSSNPEHVTQRYLMCVTHVGSNYVNLEDPHRHSWRIHLNNFDRLCALEPNAADILRSIVQEKQTEVMRLLGRVKEETARLAVSPESTSETQALARIGSGLSPKEYKASLIKAKTETLPDLFKQIEEANEALATWMKADLLPLKAQASKLTKVISKIDDRIFNVELYAGLVETVKQIIEGKPAPTETKVHLHQRRCYMDEECLAQYEVGGMDFQNIGAFDNWLARPANFDRLLPHPRCIVAFRVRRSSKHRDVSSLGDFLRLMQEKDSDKYTFLYLRNGENLYRLRTEIEFDAKLFPDLDDRRLERDGIYADCEFGRANPEKIISKSEYQAKVEEEERKAKAYEEYRVRYRAAYAAALKAALKSPEAKARAKEAGRKKPNKEDAGRIETGMKDPWFLQPSHSDRTAGYEPFNTSSVYYDDIQGVLEDNANKHNRIALIVQGLLDRSPVFHPHPPWEIWNEAGFKAALELIYDDSRALVAGPKPDFEAYRQKLNKKLKVGSVTVGQQKVWMAFEREKENKRRSHLHSYRYGELSAGAWWKPQNNPGPGVLAKPTRIARTGACTYEWSRERLRELDYWKAKKVKDPNKIRSRFVCPSNEVFNVSAYKPGDFRQFFDDPRTRHEYLQWAPLLLIAEEYHAGNRKLRVEDTDEAEDNSTPPLKNMGGEDDEPEDDKDEDEAPESELEPDESEPDEEPDEESDEVADDEE